MDFLFYFKLKCSTFHNDLIWFRHPISSSRKQIAWFR